jgi:hypothetical protein
MVIGKEKPALKIGWYYVTRNSKYDEKDFP